MLSASTPSKKQNGIKAVVGKIEKGDEMKSHLNRILAIAALGFVTVCASASPASAQGVFKGHFTLPNDVSWQGQNLPAGEYTFSLKSASVPAQLTVTGANGDSVFIITTATDERNAGGKSFMTVQHQGPSSFIRELYLAGLGLDLRYRVPKNTNDEQRIAQGPVTTERILIAANTSSQK
jgi:hypothetical protein